MLQNFGTFNTFDKRAFLCLVCQMCQYLAFGTSTIDALSQGFLRGQVKS